jgi:hypothetical protein
MNRPSDRGEFEVLGVARWQIHHGGCQGQALGLWGQLTKIRVGDELAYVREAVHGDRFLITGPMRIRMKEGEVPAPLFWALEVLGTTRVRALVDEEERATAAAIGKEPRPVVAPKRQFTAQWAERTLAEGKAAW